MGPENSGGQFVAYMDSDGNPVEIGQPLPEVTPDYSTGGVTTEEASKAMAAASKAWADVSSTMEVAAEGLREFFRAMELSAAIWAAQILEPEMVRRYLHTKKKRTHKKYEKRILAWFREVLG